MSLWSTPGGPDERLGHLRRLRRAYQAHPLRSDDLPAAPGTAFAQWFDEAEAAGIIEPNAMSLATAGADGVPSIRTVLLKAVSDSGFTFFTNYTSRKGRQLSERPRAALLFVWLPQFRQIEVTGEVIRLPPDESDAYFDSRPPDSQLAAWASPQSQEIAGRAQLRAAWDRFAAQYPTGKVPRPPHWGGFQVRPFRLEFWQGQPSRMHDRIEYRTVRGGPGDLGDGSAWKKVRLAP